MPDKGAAYAHLALLAQGIKSRELEAQPRFLRPLTGACKRPKLTRVLRMGCKGYSYAGKKEQSKKLVLGNMRSIGH